MIDGTDGTAQHPSAARQRERAYRRALADFRLDRGHCVEPVIARIVEAAVFLVDPAGVLFLGENPECAEEYDAMSARVWRRLCDAVDEGAEVSGVDVHQIVAEEHEREFVSQSALDLAFASIVSAEFKIPLPTYTTPEVDEVAALIWRRLCAVPLPGDR